jgi:nitroreductase
MFDILKKRISVRKYKKSKIPSNLVEKLMFAVNLSPSSRNLRPQEYIFVDDELLLEKLSSAKLHGGNFIKDAPLAIVVLADTEKSDVWIEDTSIASIIIQLAAIELGLATCWVQIRNRSHNSNLSSSKYIKQLFTIPERYEIESIIALGFAENENSKNATVHNDTIHLNEFKEN